MHRSREMMRGKGVWRGGGGRSQSLNIKQLEWKLKWAFGWSWFDRVANLSAVAGEGAWGAFHSRLPSETCSKSTSSEQYVDWIAEKNLAVSNKGNKKQVRPLILYWWCHFIPAVCCRLCTWWGSAFRGLVLLLWHVVVKGHVEWPIKCNLAVNLTLKYQCFHSESEHARISPCFVNLCFHATGCWRVASRVCSTLPWLANNDLTFTA